MTFHWGVAQLNGAPLSTDPRISLMNLIKTKWEPVTPFTVPLARITVDTKNVANAKENSIIIEKMPQTSTEEEIGNARKRVVDHYRIYVSSKGFSQINNAYLMKEHLDDILDANVRALTSAGIDLVHVDDVELLADVEEDKLKMGQAQIMKTTTYIMRVSLIYDKVLVVDT